MPLAIAATDYVLTQLQRSAAAPAPPSAATPLPEQHDPSEKQDPSELHEGSGGTSIGATSAPNSLVIITGRGRGSRGRVPLMQQALLKRLRSAVILPDNRGRVLVNVADELAARGESAAAPQGLGPSP